MAEIEGIDSILPSKKLGNIKKSGEVAASKSSSIESTQQFKSLYTHYASKLQGAQAQEEIQKIARVESQGVQKEIQEIQKTMESIHAQIKADYEGMLGLMA